VPNAPGWNSPSQYMNPRVIRLNAEFAWKWLAQYSMLKARCPTHAGLSH
jgi:hypothetical protein